MSGTRKTALVSGVAVPDVPAKLFVDGEWRDAADGATFDVVAPASEEHLATVAAASQDDVDAAVRAVFDEVVHGIADQARAGRVGDPFDEQTTMGAIINQRQLDRVLGYIQRGAEEGSELITGGRRPDRKGYFVEPTVFSGGGNDIAIARDEIFGPVGLVLPFDDVADAIRQANDTRYGLAAYVWTRDLSRAHELAGALRAGAIWINGPGAPDARLPWGGTKMSGIGRELGWAGIEASTEEKTVTITL